MNTIFNIPFDAKEFGNHLLAIGTVVLFFYIFMTIGRHAAGKTGNEKTAQDRANQLLDMIQLAPNNTELSLLRQTFEEFQYDFQRLINHDLFVRLSGEISAAISNRDAQINHRWYSLSSN